MIRRLILREDILREELFLARKENAEGFTIPFWDDDSAQIAQEAMYKMCSHASWGHYSHGKVLSLMGDMILPESRATREYAFHIKSLSVYRPFYLVLHFEDDSLYWRPHLKADPECTIDIERLRVASRKTRRLSRND